MFPCAPKPAYLIDRGFILKVSSEKSKDNENPEGIYIYTYIPSDSIHHICSFKKVLSFR